MWQRGIKVVDGIQVTNQLTLKRKGYLCYSDWPSAVAVVLKSGGGGKKRGVRERETMMEAGSEVLCC